MWKKWLDLKDKVNFKIYDITKQLQLQYTLQLIVINTNATNKIVNEYCKYTCCPISHEVKTTRQ